MRNLLLSGLAIFGLSAQAELLIQPVMEIAQSVQSVQTKNDQASGGWVVGDRATYDIDLGIASGTLDMFIREETQDSWWVQQDIDLNIVGKQVVEMRFLKKDMSLVELLVNGEKQEIPKPTEQEIEETRDEKVTVPAGTFDSLYARIRDVESNKTSEVWINPQTIPVFGMIKQLAPGQFGQVTLELTSFQKM